MVNKTGCFLYTETLVIMIKAYVYITMQCTIEQVMVYMSVCSASEEIDFIILSSFFILHFKGLITKEWKNYFVDVLHCNCVFSGPCGHSKIPYYM